MEAGQSIEVEYRVKPSDLAKALSDNPEDDFPEVFATSRMIAIMELAAARLMKSLLSDSTLSVGVNVNVTHMAATPANALVKAKAVFLYVEKNLYYFDVSIEDAAGIAGKGTHSRAIIETSRLLDGATKRSGS